MKRNFFEYQRSNSYSELLNNIFNTMFINNKNTESHKKKNYNLLDFIAVQGVLSVTN